jgi:hypothetical protein
LGVSRHPGLTYPFLDFGILPANGRNRAKNVCPTVSDWSNAENNKKKERRLLLHGAEEVVHRPFFKGKR